MRRMSKNILENFELIPWINNETKNIFISLETFATSLNFAGDHINVSWIYIVTFLCIYYIAF